MVAGEVMLGNLSITIELSVAVAALRAIKYLAAGEHPDVRALGPEQRLQGIEELAHEALAQVKVEEKADDPDPKQTAGPREQRGM